MRIEDKEYFRMRRLDKCMIAILLIGALFVCVVCFGAEVEISIPAIIQIESGGDPEAYNPASGAIGLMQITPICLEDYFEQETKGAVLGVMTAKLYNPEINKKVGTWYLNERIPELLKAYGIEDIVANRLISYNAGIGVLRQYLAGKRELPNETKDYLRKYEEIVK